MTCGPSKTGRTKNPHVSVVPGPSSRRLLLTGLMNGTVPLNGHGSQPGAAGICWSSASKNLRREFLIWKRIYHHEVIPHHHAEAPYSDAGHAYRQTAAQGSRRALRHP